MGTSSSGLWPVRPLLPTASIAKGCSIPIRVIEDASASASSRPVAPPANATAKPSGGSTPPTSTTSRGPPMWNGSVSGGPATRAIGRDPSQGLPRISRDLCRFWSRNPLQNNHFRDLQPLLRYKIPHPHRYKIPGFPIPLSWWGLSPFRPVLRYKRTSASTSTVWHTTAWPSFGMVPEGGPVPHE